MRIVTMSESGRLTLPVETRRALGLEGATEFEVEVNEKNDALILRPAVLLRREDAWAYTPEHRARVARAREDIKKGRVYRLTASQIERLADDPEGVLAELRKKHGW